MPQSPSFIHNHKFPKGGNDFPDVTEKRNSKGQSKAQMVSLSHINAKGKFHDGSIIPVKRIDCVFPLGRV